MINNLPSEKVRHVICDVEYKYFCSCTVKYSFFRLRYVSPNAISPNPFHRKDILPNGRFTERPFHRMDISPNGCFTEWTFYRIHFTEWMFYRMDISTNPFYRMDVFPKMGCHFRDFIAKIVIGY